MLSVTIISIGVAACEREPTAPLAAPAEAGTAPSLSVAELDGSGWEALLPVGVADVPIPPDNDWSRIDWTDWKPTGIEIAAGWVYVRVQGGVHYAWNPECATVPHDVEPCGGTPGEEGTSGPWGALGRVSIGFADVGGTTITHEAPGAAFAPAGDSATYALLAPAPRPRTIHIERQMELGGARSSSGSIGVPRYLLSGSQSVTVEQVPAPLRVVAPAFVRDGETVVAAIEPRPPFRIRMPPGFSRTAISWGFTTVDALGRPGYRYSLWSCSGQSTCALRLPADGFFNVSTYVETNKVQANGEIVRSVDPAIELVCSAPADSASVRHGGPAGEVRLVRGEVLACAAGGYPAGTEVRVTGWTFTGDDGFVSSPEVEELGTGWAGPMATSGRISVTAELEGVEQEVGVEISVLPRDWSDRRVDVVARRGSAGHDGALPLRPRGDFHLSSTAFRARAPHSVTFIEGGPNRGIGFLHAIPLEVEALVLINEAALTEGSEFQDLQDPDRSGARDWPQCGRSIVPGLAPGLLAHEGLGAADANSHIGAYERELDARLGGAAAELEAVVAGDPAELESRYGHILADLHHAASAASAALDDTGGGRFVPLGAGGSPCELRYHFAYDQGA